LELPEDADTLGLKPGDEVDISLATIPDRYGQVSAGDADDGAARERARIAAIDAAVGSLAHVGVSVEDLHRERQLDKAREEREIERYMR
jgi:hypothetical protein